jgi:hypothetical protein
MTIGARETYSLHSTVFSWLQKGQSKESGIVALALRTTCFALLLRRPIHRNLQRLPFIKMCRFDEKNRCARIPRDRSLYTP